ncbi:MAG: hypothetical protein PHH01_00325 [Patescibacteria group bacterium]|nr:hypothetical protein [Patescibacteria group bacterium]
MKWLVVLLVALAVVSSSAADVLQLAQPSEPGYINFAKTEFAVGDTVWVFNADAATPKDKNDYILPHAFSRDAEAWGIIIRACHNLTTDSGKVYSQYKVWVPAWNYDGHRFEVDCWWAIPQQGAVAYHL